MMIDGVEINGLVILRAWVPRREYSQDRGDNGVQTQFPDFSKSANAHSPIHFILKTAVARGPYPQDPGNKVFPNRSQDPQGICIPR